jgi:hypothetical protein
MKCSNFLFSMQLDIFYATEEQDKYGKENKLWRNNQTLDGYAEILGAVDRKALITQTFFEYQDKLIGRTKTDPRLSIEGTYHPITNILITNIRDKKTQEHFYLEPAGEREGKSTIYEIFAIEPYVNPWNQIEYYKILFNRSDIQSLKEIEYDKC